MYQVLGRSYTEREKAEIFRKIEPYLAFLDIPKLEREATDIQSKVAELKIIHWINVGAGFVV